MDEGEGDLMRDNRSSNWARDRRKYRWQRQSASRSSWSEQMVKLATLGSPLKGLVDTNTATITPTPPFCSRIQNICYSEQVQSGDSLDECSINIKKMTANGFRIRRAWISLQTFAFYTRQFRSWRANGFKVVKRITRRGRREFDALFASGVNVALDSKQLRTSW